MNSSEVNVKMKKEPIDFNGLNDTDLYGLEELIFC